MDSNTLRRSRRLLGAVALSAFLLLGACATVPANGPTIERLSTEHFAPTQTVDVLDAAPAAGFQRIANLGVTDPTGTATRGQLIAELVSAAQNLGANAIVVGAEQRSGGTGVGFNPSGGQMQSAVASGAVSLTAVAIRYTH